jgi:hypothetical protein
VMEDRISWFWLRRGTQLEIGQGGDEARFAQFVGVVVGWR